MVINFTTVYAPAAASFIDSNANWVPSPTAKKQMGERKFRVTPVGAGPFTVVSNKLSSQIVLKKNPTYFKKDRPFLDQLTFKSIGGDEAAYQALQAGQAQAYENLSTPSLIDQMKKNPKLQVTQQLSTVALQHPAQHERPAVQQPQGARRRSTTPPTPRRSAPSCSRIATRARRASRDRAGSSSRPTSPATAPMTSRRPRRSSRSWAD